MPSEHVISATVIAADGSTIELSITEAEVTLDEEWSPYCQAELTCSTPPEVDLERIDPRHGLRVELVLEHREEGRVATRPLNLLLREREVDHKSSTMLVVLDSDEAALQEKALLLDRSDDTAALSVLSSDFWAVVNDFVLGQIQDRNLASHAVPTRAWTVSGALGRELYVNRSSGMYLVCQRTLSGSAGVYVNRALGERLRPGITYTYRIEVFLDSTQTLQMRVYDDQVAAVANGGDVSVPAGSWQPIEVTFTMPENGRIWPAVWWHNGPIGERIFVRGLTLIEGTESLPWNPPRLATPDSVTHDFTADMRALTWEPGVDLWSLLEPLLQTAGLHLFCDELRNWHLVPSDYRRPGQLNVTIGSNITEATDTISRLNDSWYDSVVIEYSWTDENGNAHRAWDVSGEPGTKTLTIKYERPYPGPGAATTALWRATGRGRVLDIDVLSQYESTPGQTIATTLPSSPLQVGRLSSVHWQFPEGTMRVGSRGLIDTPIESWTALPTSESWTDSPAGESWSDELIGA